MPNEKSGADGRYRHRRRGGAVPTDAEQPIEHDDEAAAGNETMEPGQMAQLIVDMRSGAIDREVTQSIAGPLTDLARAFALQAEVLKSVHQNQAEIAKKLADDEKSQVVVNSTRALNDTFRGVRQVQQGLLDQLRRGERESRRGWVLVVAIAALLGVGLWFGIDRIQGERLDDTDRLRREFVDQIDAVQSGIVTDYGRRLDDAEARRVQLEAENAAHRERMVELNGRLAELSGKESIDAQELDAMRKTALDAAAEIARMEAALEESHRQKAFYVEKSERLEGEIERLRVAILDKLRDGGVDVAATASPENREKPASDAAASDSNSPSTEPTNGAGTTDPAVTERIKEQTLGAIRERVNELLARHRRGEVFKLEELAKVAADRLEGVVFSESRAKDGVLRRISAEELRFLVDPRGDLVEIEFLRGTVRTRTAQGVLGPPAPFYNDRFRLTIEPLNGEAWLAQDRGFIRVN